MELLATPRRRRVLFFGLYACEGAPIGFLWWALPPKLRADGMPVAEITALTATLVLPWTFKFLWAPLIDLLSARVRLSSWIAGAQLGMALTLLPLAFVDIGSARSWVWILLVAHALCAATQDVAIDALAIQTVPEDERGSINGFMQAGMLLGRSVFGGGALMASRFVSFRAVVGLVIAWVLATSVLSLSTRSAARPPPRERRLLAELGAALGRRSTWLGLGIALTAGAAFEAVGAVAGPLLIDRGLDTGDVGTFLFLPAVVAMTVGSLAGGRLADAVGARRATAASVGIVAATVLALAIASHGAPPVLLVILGLIYLGIGLLTASSYTLFMQLTDPRLAATQFSAFMGATNGCEAWAGFAVGRIQARAGYGTAFTVLALSSLLALPLLWASRKKPDS